MPIYEYACRKCGAAFEELVFGSVQPQCPSCKTDDIERMMSVTAPGRVKEAASPAPSPAACGGCPSARACGIE